MNANAVLLVAGAALLFLGSTPRQSDPVSPAGTVSHAEIHLQARIDAAAAGDTIVLSAGIYHGPVTIPLPVTLIGETGAVILGNGTGSVLTVEASGTTVENLEIRGSGLDLGKDNAGILVIGDSARVANVVLRENLHGIYVRGAQGVQLIGNHIVGLGALDEVPEVVGSADEGHHGDMHHTPARVQALMGNGLHLWDANGAVVEGNHVQHTRDGIYVSHTYGAVFRNNRIHDARYGIHYMYSSDNVVAGNELWQNVAGAALMFSRNLEIADNLLRDHAGFRAHGLLLQNVDGSSIRANTLQGNRVGLRMQNSSANELRGNGIHTNLVGMTLTPSSRDNALTRNEFGPNLKQLEITGPVPPGDWSVDGVGNRWHGALPMDLTGDGISEWPHHVVDLVAERGENFPYLQLLIGSPGIRGLEWALSRAPLPGTRYITDPHPLTRPVSR